MPLLGSIYTGIDNTKVKEIYWEDYKDKITPKCKKCWNKRLCSICYTSLYSDGKFDYKKMNDGCNRTKFGNTSKLYYYASLLEINPEGLNYFAEMDYA